MATKHAVNKDFLYTEECGLALFEHRGTRRRFFIPVEMWRDVLVCLQRRLSQDRED